MGTDEKGHAGKDAAALSGGHLCHVCGYQYPNPHPSAKLRRSHRKNCGKAMPPAPAVAEDVGVGEREEAAGEGHAAEGTRLGGGGGGQREEITGARSEANGGGAASRGSAGEVDTCVENKVIAEHASPIGTGAQVVTIELNENNHLINCGNSESASPEDIGTQTITSESENGLADCSCSSIEIVNEGNGTESQIDCTDEGQTKVGHPAEREDSFDEYQDASPFLLQSDSEDGAAPSSVFSTAINILNTASLGSSVAANEISLETNGLCKDQFSGETNMRNLSADPQVGYNVNDRALRLAEPEVNLKFGDPYEHSVDVDNTYTNMVNSKSDKTSCHCEMIGDSNASSLQETCPLVLQPELESTCSGKVEGFMEDRVHVLHTMSEESPRPVLGADNVRLETITDPITNAMPIGSDLKVVCTDNTPTDCSTKLPTHITNAMPIGSDLKVICTDNTPTPTDCSMKLPTQNWTVEDISDDHQPVKNSCNKVLECPAAGFQYDIPVTNADDIPATNVDDLEFTCQERPEPDAVEENTSVQKTNVFTEEEVCNKQIDTEIPKEDQFSMSQKHANLLMDPASFAKNPFNLDDDKNDDLFELPTDSCYLEVPNAVESRQLVESISLVVDQPIVSNQIRMADAQQCHNTTEHILSASNGSENGEFVGPEVMPISSGSELMNMSYLTDHGIKEDEAHTRSIIFVPSEVASMELSTVSTQDISALSTKVEENTRTEDATAKEMPTVHSIDCIEMKQAIDTTTKDTYAVHIEEKKLTEGTAAGMNEVQHTHYVEEQMQAGGTKDVSAAHSIGNLEENKQSEESNANETNAWCNPDDVEDKTLAAKEMMAAESTDNVEEKHQPNVMAGQDGSSNKQNEEIAATGAQPNSGRVRVPLKVLLAEASAENQVKKPSTKERVLSFRRRVSKDSNSSATGSDDHHWSSPAKLPRKDVDKSSKGRKQPWMPFICCHSVH